MSKLNKELHALSEPQLVEKIDGWRKELFGLRLQSITSHVKDMSQFKKIRKNIARGCTILQEKLALHK